MKSLLLIALRIILAGLVLLYLSSAVPGFYRWTKIKQVRAEPVETLQRAVDRSVIRRKPEELVFWIASRPEDDSRYLLETLPAMASDLPSNIFFDLAKRAQKLGRHEDYLFWTFYARFRLRYDLLRCGDPDAVKMINTLADALGTKDIATMAIENNPGKMADMIEKILDFDAHHPARNDPSPVCTHILKIKKNKFAIAPPSEWAAVRHVLRNVTERGVKELRREAQGSAAGAPETP